MPSSMFFPLDNIKPSEILSQYSEWIYFTLTLVFFISIAGIALRKHFDKPYVKPLIITVGLMLTFGVFRFKEQLTSIFESWGILGTILLVVMLAMIPYGLCRGFGLPASKAFFLSYILVYILSWVKFSEFYNVLADHNLGLVNLGLLILFFVSVYKLFRPRKFSSILSEGLSKVNPLSPEIEKEIRDEDQEKEMITGVAEKMTKWEIRSLEDIAETLNKIISTVETNRNQLPKEEREQISKYLVQISKEEGIFTDNVQKLQRLFQRLNTVDAQHFNELKSRFEKATGKEKKIIKAELEAEEEKIQIERAIFEFERKLSQGLNLFNQCLKSAIEHIRNSPHPYDCIHSLSEGKKVLTNIFNIIKETGQLEKKLLSLVKMEKKLLKKEKQIA